MSKAKRKEQRKLLLFSGLILIVLGLAIEVLIISLRYENLWIWYADVQKWLAALQEKIEALNISWKFVAAIMALYLVKCFFPIYTTSAVFFITAAVFSGLDHAYRYSILLNIAGCILQFSIKYYMGYKRGAPWAWKFISKNEHLKHIIESGGSGNPYTLLALRSVPITPVNIVSSIYGSFSFNFIEYLIISLLGFLPRMIMYTFAGHNTFDPLSLKFLVPIMILCFLSGITMLSANGAWTAIDKFSHMYKKKKASESLKQNNDKESA